MTEKDWITMLIPIFCNGIIVFVFSKLLEANKTKRQTAETKYKKLIMEMKSIVEEIFPFFYNDDKREMLQLISNKMDVLISFFRKNKVRLTQYDQIVGTLQDTWDSLVAILHYSQEHEGGIISKNSSMKIAPLVGKLYDELFALASQYNKDLYERGMYS